MAPSGEESGPGRGEIPPQDREAFRRRAAEIGHKLDTVKAQRNPPVEQISHGAAYGKAMKIAVELVVGVLVGAFLGRVLDSYLGTAPWLLVLFVMLGFAAGMLNVIRSARRIQAQAEPLQRSAKDVAEDEDD